MQLPARYSKVVKVLSGGGMSDTQVCFDDNLKRDVVIKTLKPGIEKHRLMDELSALADIRSPHVVQVLDVIRENNEIVGFVEEYIEGKDLAPFSASVGEAEALRSLYSIASGISDIHENGRVHRDIKPDNMKLDKSGVLKIFDFGLAKLSTNAKTKQLYFTQGYTAPEVFTPDKNGHHNFTEAVDVFAFGATALWLLNGGNLVSDLQPIPPCVPALPVTFNAVPVKLSAGINSLLNRCLCLSATDRPSAADLKKSLGKQLLFNKHRMLLTVGSANYFVDASNPQVKLNSGNDVVEIAYDGLNFVVKQVTGHVRHNNKQVIVGYVLQGASVIVLGDPQKRGRTSITADISHPEVLI